MINPCARGGPLSTDPTATALRCASSLLGGVGQVGILVDDVERAVAEASALFPISRWRAYRYGSDNVRDLTYRGQPSTMEFWVVLSDVTPQVEYVQTVRGPNIYTEWLDRHQVGVHHIGVYTDSLDADVERLTAHGLTVVQSGRGYGLDGDGGFAYFDTLDSLGVILELIAVPARRRPPDREWVVTRDPE